MPSFGKPSGLSRSGFASRLQFALVLSAIAVVYFAAAKLGLAMAFVAPQVTVVWPPTGIALAAVMLLGQRVWPAIWIGALLANATAAEPLPVAAGIATGNTLEAVVGGWLLSRWRVRPSLDRIRHVVGLLAGGSILSTTISATIGVASLCLGGLRAWSEFDRIWIVWWLGDAMSILVVAPLLLAWSRWRVVRSMSLRIVEGLALLGMVVGALWWIFTAPIAPATTPLHYALFPFVILAALRFGQLGTTAVNAIASAIAIWGTAAGLGPFGSGEVAHGLVQAQLFLAVVAGTGLVLAAEIGERARGDRFRSADYSATHALAESLSLGQGASGVLRAVCQSLDWDFGSIWLLDRGAQVLRCLETWHDPARHFGEFEAATRSSTFPPGVGLPGRVWASGEPAWIRDVVVDTNFPRAAVAASEGLHGAFAFPIRRGGEVLGVIEFFSRELQQPDADLLARIAALGTQIGQFIERQRVELAMRESEARNRAIVDAALDCIVTMDREGRISEFNPAAERTFGYRRDEAIGRPLADLLIPPHLRERHRNGVARFLENGRGRMIGQRIEIAATRADGAIFPIELTVGEISVDGLPAFTGYLRDISEQRRAEDEREHLLARERAARAEAEHANRAKDEFLAMLGHELRNPLGAIVNATHVLERESDERIAASRGIIARQAAHLTRLVDDLLDVARVQSGRIELQREAVDLGELVEHCAQTLVPADSVRARALSLSTPSLLVDADPARLEQIVTNLLENALKYTVPGGRISVSVRREHDRALLCVEDDGIGIARDLLPRIFDLFVQADRSLDRSKGGLGLGLTLVKRLVGLHGGTVTAHSEGPGRGSEFVVELPLARSEDVRTAAPEPSVSPLPCRVLIVEDHPDSREGLRLLLITRGHSVKVASDGEEGLRTLRSWRPDVAIVDIGLPGLDGYALARAVRTEPELQGVLLVALTGYGLNEDRQQAIDAGFEIHLVKPVTLEALGRVFDKARPT